MRYVVGFFKFWYDFLIGDAWEIAAGVVAVMVIGALLLSGQPALAGVFGFFLAVVVSLILSLSVWLGWRERRPTS